MVDATLRQGNRLIELVLKADDSPQFIQNLIERWGAVQLIGRGEVSQSDLLEALSHIKTNAQGAQALQGQPLYILEQVRLLSEMFSQLDISHVEENITTATAQLMPGASLFCYVRTTTMATHFGIKKPWDNFGDLTEKTVGLLVSRRKFYNYRAGQFGAVNYRLLASTAIAMQELEAQQKGDIIVIPAQLGELYMGKTVETSRDLIGKSGSQFCLPAFIVGQILLVNPEILTSNRNLFVDCPGDKYRLGAREPFNDTLYFDVDENGLLCLDSSWTSAPYGLCGSAWGVFQ